MVLMPLFGLEVPKRLCDQRARNTNKASKDCSRFRALQVSQLCRTPGSQTFAIAAIA
jgi:hypothetical protein